MTQPSKSEGLPEVYKQYAQALESMHGERIYKAHVPEIKLQFTSRI